MRGLRPIRSATCLLVAAYWVLVCSAARAADDPNDPSPGATDVANTPPSANPDGAAAASQPEDTRRIRFDAGLAAIYVTHGGTNFDGHHGYIFDDTRVAHLPSLSGGFGIRPNAGVLFEHLLPSLRAMVNINLERSWHSAISYNAGNAAYKHPSATLTNASLELRAILDIIVVKPYVALAPGYGWLRLPSGITVIDPAAPYATWQDVTLRGLTFQVSWGATFQISNMISAGGAFGYCLRGYSSSSVASLSGMGFSPGVVGSLGVDIIL